MDFKIIRWHFRAEYVQCHAKCSVSVIIKIAFFLMPSFQPSASLGLVWLHKYWEACSPQPFYCKSAWPLAKKIKWTSNYFWTFHDILTVNTSNMMGCQSLLWKKLCKTLLLPAAHSQNTSAPRAHSHVLAVTAVFPFTTDKAEKNTYLLFFFANATCISQCFVFENISVVAKNNSYLAVEK